MSHLVYNLRFGQVLTADQIRAKLLPSLKHREYCFDDDQGGLFIEDSVGRIRIEYKDGENWVLHFIGAYSPHLFQLLTSLDAEERLDARPATIVEDEIKSELDRPEIQPPTAPMPLVADLTPVQQRLLRQIEDMSGDGCDWISLDALEFKQLPTLLALVENGFIDFDQKEGMVRLSADLEDNCDIDESDETG